MKAPQVTVGRFRVRYIQVPYTNRFFELAYSAPYPTSATKEQSRLLLPVAEASTVASWLYSMAVNEPSAARASATVARIRRFFDRRAVYDAYLDAPDN